MLDDLADKGMIARLALDEDALTLARVDHGDEAGAPQGAAQSRRILPGGDDVGEGVRLGGVKPRVGPGILKAPATQ